MYKDVKDFCNRHSIRIIDASKKAHRITKLNYTLVQTSQQFDHLAHSEIFHDTEPLYTVEISESELERIAEIEATVIEQGNYNLLEVLMAQQRHEKYLKDKFPSVKNAYEQYRLLLKLAESGEL